MIAKIKYSQEDNLRYNITLENGTSANCSTETRHMYSDAVNEWIAEGNKIEAYKTSDELLKEIEDAKPKVVTMRQARLALLQSGLLQTVTDAIANGTDEAMKIEWEYATEVKRDWASLMALTTSLGMTSLELDDLFQLASTL